MQKWLSFLLLSLINLPAIADTIPIPPPPLDSIAFELSQKQWVQTKTALLTVEINATLSGGDVVQTRKTIMDKIAQIAKGDWHITRFDRSQDSSGLEKLSILAEIRLDQDKLTNVYTDAKKISKPGMNFAIQSVDFTPGLEDMQAARQALREQLYQKINEEMARINAAYKDQHYSLNKLNFSEGGNISINSPRTAKMNVLYGAAAPAPAASADIPVSNELIMTAAVEVASNRVKGD